MTTYQALIDQALAVEFDQSISQPLRHWGDRKNPQIVIRPLHDEETQRFSQGGTRIGIEFESEESDLLRALKEGLLFVEDFLSSLCLVAGVPFLATTPLQILENSEGSSHRFLRFLPLIGLSWATPLSASDFQIGGSPATALEGAS